ncbi:MAG: glycine zipper 2TM domain-containing protein [Candidatus Omnitrophica bacterium]|nr:glycine zipper 2TM domain-containing protein [Candidatus Omnitrophota bacterium]
MGFLVFLVVALALLGCETMGPKSKTGAVAGGVIGATAGGIIGHQSEHGLEGAAIGAAIGAVTGAVIGSQLDKMDKQGLQSNPNYLPITKIVEMTSTGLPDDVIIEEIKRTKSVYHLSAEVIDYLKKNKVGDKVIDYMLSTAAATP